MQIVREYPDWVRQSQAVTQQNIDWLRSRAERDMTPFNAEQIRRDLDREIAPFRKHLVELEKFATKITLVPD